MKKDYINDIEGAERRFIDPLMEVRAEGDDDKEIKGIAAVVEKTTDLGWFEERISKGAFDEVLGGDTVALFNHEANLPLARTTAKDEAKLKLSINKEGHLAYSYPPPKTTMGKDLTQNIRSGVIQHSSFAFTIKEEKWEFASTDNGREKDLRTIIKIERLFDVSPVTYPAYIDTSVASRSKEKLTKPDIELGKSKRERIYLYEQIKNDK
jgi:uncharacterized protein